MPPVTRAHNKRICNCKLQILNVFQYCSLTVKLCDYADTTPRDNIHTIKRQINLKFITECNVQCYFSIGICFSCSFYQRVSIASYANRWYSQRRNVRLSVCLSVTLRYCIKTKKASVMISSPPESLNIPVSRNIWIITKFDRGHPERGRFLRLGWVRTGDFGDFSTNKPPYLRNDARYDQGAY